MVDGTYLIEVDTPLGRKTGTAELTTSGDVLNARVKAPIIGKQEANGIVDGDTFSAEGALKIPFKGEVHYTIEGDVVEDIITARFHTSRGDFTIIGARM